MNTSSTDYAAGDRIAHLERPEWGEGTIQRAQTVFANGGQAQRLVVRFANHGLVTLNTAFAQIRSLGGNGKTDPRSDGPPNAAAPAESAQPAMPSMMDYDRETFGDPAKARENLVALPEPARDPFLGLDKRMDHTLNLYRFDKSGRTLLDWAVAQTGLDDPLSHLPRTEIEQQFDQFRRNLDEHLRGLLTTAKRNGRQDLVERGRKHSLPAAREAVKRALAR